MPNNKINHTAHTIFWLAPDESILERKIIAAGLCHSVRWIELLEKAGNGPPTLRVGHKKLTKKIDAIQWFQQLSKIPLEKTNLYLEEISEKENTHGQ